MFSLAGKSQCEASSWILPHDSAGDEQSREGEGACVSSDSGRDVGSGEKASTLLEV